MTHRFLNIATIQAVAVQIGVGILFYCALTKMKPLGFGAFPAFY